MALSPQFSTEFVDRAKAVTQAPDDYYTKAETLGMLMQMKALAASGDAMAQYRLAQVYPKNSAPYLTWMQAAAQQDFTNAMLALSLALAENGTVSGLQQAAQYMVRIFNSEDSYIKQEAKDLLTRNRLLNSEVQRQMSSTSVGKSAVSFFAREESNEAQQPEEKQSYSLS